MSPIPAIQVKPGETTRLELGKTGRPVIGRLVFPETIKAPSEIRFWGSLYQSRQPPEPLQTLTIEEKRRRAQEETMTYRSYGLCIQPDGSFRTEDVTPGRYYLHATLVKQNDRGQGFANAMLGRVNHEIVVPEIPGRAAYISEPFDVGSLAVKPEHRLDAGQLAPEFQATTYDGKPVRLSDFRGKYLLIVFWSKSFQHDLTLVESRNLRALNKTFGKLGRFAMLGINYDDEVDRTRNLVTQRGWDWLNASVSFDVWDKLLDEYSLPRHGSVWLLGPEGKVLARDLRGDAIRQAGTMVLRAK